MLTELLFLGLIFAIQTALYFFAVSLYFRLIIVARLHLPKILRWAALGTLWLILSGIMIALPTLTLWYSEHLDSLSLDTGWLYIAGLASGLVMLFLSMRKHAAALKSAGFSS